MSSQNNHRHPFEEALGLGLTVPLPPGTLTTSRRSHNNSSSGREDGNATSMPNSFTGATLVPLSRNVKTMIPPSAPSARDRVPTTRSISPHPPQGGRDPYPRDGTVGIDDHRHHRNNHEDYREEEYSGDEMDRYYARKYEEELDDEIVPYSRPVHSDLDDEDSDDEDSDGEDTDAEYDGERRGVPGGDAIADEDGDHDEDKDEDADSSSEEEESSVVSLTPPPSLPLLVVNLNRLCGYDPSGVEEADAMRRRIEEELLGTTNSNNNKSSQPPGATEVDSETPPPPPPPPDRSSSGSASPSSVVDTPCSTTIGDDLVVSSTSTTPSSAAAAASVSPTGTTGASGPRQSDAVTATDESSPPVGAEGHLEGEVVATENEADADADAGDDDGGGENQEGRGGGEGSTESSFRGGAGAAEEAETGGPGTEGSDVDVEAEVAAPSHGPPVTDVVTVGDGLSLNFASRSTQLFDAGVASHADTSVLPMPTAPPSRSRSSQPDDVDGEADGRGGDGYHSRLLVVEGKSGRRVYYCALPYPEYLGTSSSGGGDQQTSVSRSWKLLLRPHPIPPVHTILSLLAKSSRPLPWKIDMNECIRSLAKTEWRERQRRMQRVALERWRNVDRPERLDGLYETRDVFRDRLDDAEVRLDVLRRRRLESTSGELARRRYGGDDDDDDGTVKDDLAGETFDFLLREEDGGGGVDDVPGGDDSPDDEEEYYGSGEDDDDDDDEGDDARGRRRRRREHRPRTRRGRPPKETTAAVAVIAPRKNNDERDRKWREEKRRILASSVTPEERAAEALVDGLRRRLAGVDDLLESLQEEEWAEEEEEEEGEGPDEAFEAEPVDDVDTQDGGFSLLDQILAMIMGSQPDPELERLMTAAKTEDGGERSSDDAVVEMVQDDDSRTEELERRKFLRLRSCHEDTVRAWREHFGRLPRHYPGPGSTSRASAAEEARDGGVTTSGFGAAAHGDYSTSLDKSGERDERITTNRLSGDEGSEWEQVENWEDLVVPDHDAAGAQNKGTSKTTTTAIATNVNLGSLAPASVVERKAPSFGLRPGGRLKQS